jgi:hypothetical protein
LFEKSLLEVAFHHVWQSDGLEDKAEREKLKSTKEVSMSRMFYVLCNMPRALHKLMNIVITHQHTQIHPKGNFSIKVLQIFKLDF